MVTILHNVNSLLNQVHNKSVVHTAHLSGVLAPRILFSITLQGDISPAFRNVIPATSACSKPNKETTINQSSSSSSACTPRKRIFVFFCANLLEKHVSAPQFCAHGTCKESYDRCRIRAVIGKIAGDFGILKTKIAGNLFFCQKICIIHLFLVPLQRIFNYHSI